MSDTLKLVIGDKNLSSWSMRAWLAAKASGLPFEEVMILLDRPETTNLALQKNSPSSRVPCLIHGDLSVWDSLAICEYLAELSPNKNLWPEDSRQRARARSYAAEMHSSFQSLRSHLSMDIRLKMEVRHLGQDTIKDISRVIKLWSEALQDSGGPFLFGKYGIVDAFYAPVVFRFLSYGIQIKSDPALKYMNEIKNHPDVKAWVKDALSEVPQVTRF
jgi:glutathione S-transferase